MTKKERLEWENQKMKETLRKIHGMCNMSDEEQEKYLKEFKHADSQFYPLAVGAISYMAREGLAAVGIEM